MNARALALCGISISLTLAAVQVDGGEAPTRGELRALGLAGGRVLHLSARASASLELPITLDDGSAATLELIRTPVRGGRCRVLHPAPGGGLEEVAQAPACTYRGVVRSGGEIIGDAAAAVLPDGIYARILLDAGEAVLNLEPCRGALSSPRAGSDRHVLYSSAEVISDTPRTCGALGVEDALDFSYTTPLAPRASTAEAATVKLAEMAIDADFEYYQIYGSTSAVQSRVETLINLLNVQYERDVGIRLQLGTLVVRDTAADPYTQTDAGALLDELQSEWTSNQSGVTRDIVHLFTGRELDGSTIGIAYLGVVCNNSFGYGLSQVDFTSNIESSTDLLAHEIGHNFNADHCTCPTYTMNPTITSANRFNPTATIPVIEAFRDAVACLATVEANDVTAPTVTIDSPAGGTVVSTSASFTASASDASGIASVAFYLDGSSTAFATDTASPYTATLDTSALSEGSHTITATATDSSQNANTASDSVSIQVLLTPQADPGFPYADANRDGLFSVDDGDVALTAAMLTDGVFDTRKSESGYPGASGVDLVVPAGVGALQIGAAKGLKLTADGDITVNVSLTATESSGSIILRSRDGDVTLGDASNTQNIQISGPKKVQVTAKKGAVTADRADITGGRIQVVSGGDVDIDTGGLTATNVLVARSSAGAVLLDSVTAASTSLKGKITVKGAGITASSSSLSATKVVLGSSAGITADGSSVLACGSDAGVVVVSSAGTASLVGATVLAGKKVALKKGDIDITSATVANSTDAGKVTIQGPTIDVEGATVLDGGTGDMPSLQGTVVGTPLTLGGGTSSCP